MATERCPICEARALLQQLSNMITRVQCDRCGTFDITRKLADDWPYERARNPKAVPLACHLIRKYQSGGQAPILEFESFLDAIKSQRLPRPAEAANYMVLWIGSLTRDTPGHPASGSPAELAAVVGLTSETDVGWLLGQLDKQGLATSGFGVNVLSARLTFDGWSRFEELQRIDRESRFAFLARKFDDSELDVAVKDCLAPAIEKTGFELRMAPQKAGLIDALIENEIRRSRFLVADLSDMNAGAYWEAGFAEGLGKPVFYVCKAGVATHFDTNHRNTVWWDPKDLKPAENKLKALVRNTLLGDAKQTDD